MTDGYCLQVRNALTCVFREKIPQASQWNTRHTKRKPDQVNDGGGGYGRVYLQCAWTGRDSI